MGRTALMFACGGGHLDIVVMLIKAGADINAIDFNGWNPLLWASFNARSDVIVELLKYDVDVNKCDSEGRSNRKSSKPIATFLLHL